MPKYFLKRYFVPEKAIPESEYDTIEVTKDEYIRIGLEHTLVYKDDIPENLLMRARKNNVCCSATHIFWVEDD